MPTSDAAHFLGGDLQVGPTGDLAMATAQDKTQQRLYRRLLTNPGAYLWNLAYGAGLGQFVGQPASPLRVRAVITGQIFQESGISLSPAPTVTVVADQVGNMTANVTYADALTDTTQGLTVPIS